MPKVILGKPVDEEKWAEAKRRAAEEGQSDNYAYIIDIYKKISHLTKSDIDFNLKKKYIKGRLKLVIAKTNFFNTEVRCSSCHALLYRFRFLHKSTVPSIEIKCRRCGTFNII